MQAELDRSEKDRKAALDEKGMKDFFSFPVGSTIMVVDVDIEPRKTDFGRMAIRANINDVDYDVPLTDLVYNKVLKRLVAGKNIVEIVRTGTGKNDTRYDVVKTE